MHCTNFEKKNDTHIYGTPLPVEEPSTASEADLCTAAINAGLKRGIA